MSEPTPAPRRLTLIAAFAALYIIWGSTYLGIRFAIESIPPLLMAGVRFFLAGVIMYAIALWQGAPKIFVRGMAHCAHRRGMPAFLR